jgi:hypothetical protein
MCIVGEALVPCTRGLLEAVERLVEPTNMLGMIGVDEARWLLAVDHLIKIAMKKGVLDVELMNRPCTRDGDAEDNTDCGGLDDGAECLIEINSQLLREPTNNPSRLVASKAAIRSKLVLEDPFS